MTNKDFNFNTAFKKILYILEALNKEEVNIVPALRINEFYKPGRHGPNQQVYVNKFLCLALAKKDGFTISYLENARFGPGTDISFLKFGTEKVSNSKIQVLTIEEFKKEIDSYLFVPIQPGESDFRLRDMIDQRNDLFIAIEVLYREIAYNKLADLYEQGE